MDIKTDDYELHYDEATHTIQCAGSLRLNGLEEYAPIVNILNEVAAQDPPLHHAPFEGVEFPQQFRH